MTLKGTLKVAPHLTFQQTQLKDKIMHHDILEKPWEVIGAVMFNLNNKHYLCIVDYHSKFPIIKRTEDFSADILILICNIIFAEYGLLKEIMLESGGNFFHERSYNIHITTQGC